MAGNNTQIEKLYKELLDSWNNQDAKGMASLFAIDGSSVGFDGSQMNGKMQIESEIRQIFRSHQTARFESLPGDRTKLTSQSVFQSVADRDGMLQSGMERGVNDSYDRLDELLVKMKLGEELK